MHKDRLNDNNDRIHDLDDLIEAREERESAFADDTDGLQDVEEVDIDVDEALTFPHPHRTQEQAVPDEEPVETPRDKGIEFDYEDSREEMLPVDYTEPYSDALSTELVDDEDVVAEEEIEELGAMTPDDLIYRSTEIEPPEEGDIKSQEDLES